MAKGYWSIAGTITNPEGMGPFLQAFEAYLDKCGARFLCRDLQTDVLEGNAGHLAVIIEFQSLAAAKAAYEAPEYQEMLRLRQPLAQRLALLTLKMIVLQMEGWVSKKSD